MGPLAGKVAIVTGAGNGLGRAEALELARQGAAVVVNDLGGSVDGSSDGASRNVADMVVTRIRDGCGRAVANYADVSDWTAAGQLVDQAIDEFGRLDLVVNNAGVNRRGFVVDATEADVDTLTKVLFKGTFAVIHHAARYWTDEHRAGRATRRSVVNTSSSAGVPGGVEEFSIYGAMKAAIAALTVTAALELRPYDVVVNAICPHAATRMDAFGRGRSFEDSDPPEALAADDPRHVADVVAWLLSDEAAYITGQIFEVGGGAVRQWKQPAPGPEIATDTRWTGEDLGREMATTVFGIRPPGRTVPVDPVATRR